MICVYHETSSFTVYLNFLIVSSSRSYAMYFCCVGDSDFVMNPSGYQVSLSRCWSTAPIAKSKASTARLTGAPGIGCINIVAFARARFHSRKLFSARPDHSIVALHFVVPFNKSFSS